MGYAAAEAGAGGVVGGRAFLMAGYFLTKWFEDQLRFELSGGAGGESVSIGSTVFSPVEVLKEFNEAYKQEFNYWLDEWKPRQDELRQEHCTRQKSLSS